MKYGTVILKIKKRLANILNELSKRIFFCLNVSVEEIESRKKNNVLCYKYRGSEDIVINPPVFTKNIPNIIKKQIGFHRFSPPSVCIFENVMLSLPRAIATLKNLICIAEINYNMKTDEFLKLRESHSKKTRNIPKCLLKGVPSSVYSRTDSTFLFNIRELISMFRTSHNGQKQSYLFTMVNRNSRGYYHWIVEDLPKLEGYEYICNKLGIKPKILIDQDPPEWKKETLSLMGYKKQDFIEWDGNAHYVGKLVFSLARHKMLHICSPQACRWVKDRIIDSHNTNKTVIHNKKRIYISRAKAKLRKVWNEQEVTDLLKTYNFDSYVLEDLAFEEKVSLFQQAEFVVGPHGAGFVHLIFSRNKVCVIELFGKKIEHTNFLLSSGLGFDYSFLICESEKLKNSKDDMHLTVDVNELEILLKEMITNIK